MRYGRDADNPQSLRDSDIMSLYQDRGGVLWVGTRLGGASHWNPRSWLLGHYRSDAFRDTQVLAFADDGADKVWVGTIGSGLIEIDTRNRSERRYGTGPESSVRLSDDRVMSLLYDRKGTLWIGTMTGGLDGLDLASGKLQVFRSSAGDPGTLPANGVMSLYEDRRGVLWVGTFGGGLASIDQLSGKVTRYPYGGTGPSSLSSPRASAIVEDAIGNLWIGTEGGGLNLLDRKTGRFYTIVATIAIAAVSATIRYTRCTWTTTASCGWAPREAASTASSAARRSPAPCVSKINPASVPYESGCVRHRVGPGRPALAEHQQRPGALRSAFAFDQVVSPGARTAGRGIQFQRPLSERRRHAVLRGQQRLQRFLSGTAHRERLPAAGGPDLGGQAQSSPGAQEFPAPGSAAVAGLRRQARDLDFAALDFTSPANNHYSYRLEGFDGGWVDAGPLHRATYTNLDCGRLCVQGARRQRRWRLEQPRNWRFPCTWRRRRGRHLAARPVYAGRARCAGVSLALQRLRRERELRYSRELEQTVHARTRELEERNQELQVLSRAKSDFVARMSHELRTPMNGVLGMTSLLLDTRIDPAQRRFAEAIHRSADSLLASSTTFSISRRSRRAGCRLDPVECDLIELVEQTAEMLAARAAAKGIELLFDDPPHTRLPRVSVDAVRLRQVLVNLGGNAVKFTEHGEVTFRVMPLAHEKNGALTVRLKWPTRASASRGRINAHGIRGVCPGGRLDHAPLWRHRPRTRRSPGKSSSSWGGAALVSAPGEGSTFSFELTLPLATRPCAAAPPLARLDGLRVLVVHDNAAARALTAKRCVPGVPGRHRLPRWRRRALSCAAPPMRR